MQVLALQALQPLLLCSSTLSSQHSILLAALLADPSTPSALQLQAVATASELIAAAPARNQLLVQKLEQLVLQGLAAADSCGGGGSSSSSRCDVLAAAAGVYAVLLLHEKLLLAAVSWSVVAAGLLAPESLQVGKGTVSLFGVILPPNWVLSLFSNPYAAVSTAGPLQDLVDGSEVVAAR